MGQRVCVVLSQIVDDVALLLLFLRVSVASLKRFQTPVGPYLTHRIRMDLAP